MSKSGIYNIICLVTLKHYIGSALDFKQRWQRHKAELNRNAHKNVHLQNAWNKYGEAAFEFVVIEYVDDVTQLTKTEQLYLDGCWASGKLYNICPTAGSWFGLKHTKEAKRKISHSQKGKPGHNRGYKHSEEAKRKMSDAKKGRTVSGETKRKMSVLMKGRGHPCSDETKHKLSVINTGHKASDETKRKLSDVRKGNLNYFYGKHHSDETKRKLSLAMKGKGHPCSDETKRKLSLAKQGHPCSDETKRKISETKRARFYVAAD